MALTDFGTLTKAQKDVWAKQLEKYMADHSAITNMHMGAQTNAKPHPQPKLPEKVTKMLAEKRAAVEALRDILEAEEKALAVYEKLMGVVSPDESIQVDRIYGITKLDFTSKPGEYGVISSGD